MKKYVLIFLLSFLCIFNTYAFDANGNSIGIYGKAGLNYGFAKFPRINYQEKSRYKNLYGINFGGGIIPIKNFSVGLNFSFLGNTDSDYYDYDDDSNRYWEHHYVYSNRRTEYSSFLSELEFAYSLNFTDKISSYISYGLGIRYTDMKYREQLYRYEMDDIDLSHSVGLGIRYTFIKNVYIVFSSKYVFANHTKLKGYLYEKQLIGNNVRNFDIERSKITKKVYTPLVIFNLGAGVSL